VLFEYRESQTLSWVLEVICRIITFKVEKVSDHMRAKTAIPLKTCIFYDIGVMIGWMIWEATNMVVGLEVITFLAP
jgi:hypothetical protein